MSYRLKYNPNNNKISFNTKTKTTVNKPVSRKIQQERRQTKRPLKNTLEQRVRILENENKSLWDAIGKLEHAVGLRKSKDMKK